jgi:hypothetical protein
MKKVFITLFIALTATFSFAQRPGGVPGGSSTGASTTYAFKTAINSLWQYDSTNKMYYIVGLYYGNNLADKSYEQMGIYVPAAYMNATANSDGTTYTCTINTTAAVGGYTAATAPVVVPVNTPGYAAQSAPTGSSSSVATYTNAGFIYLWPGCRGKEAGAPSGVTDMKAAIRYFRYLQAEQNAVPGNADRIFTFGMSGGGAQSSLLGASGNSTLYNDYLTAIGADMDYKDDVCGSMCWCPITNLDQADGAYEWNMGLTRSSLGTTDQNISKGLAASFATYINSIGLKNPDTGEALTLSATDNGYYQQGSYYSYIMGVVNDAVKRYNSYNSASVSSYSTTDATALYSFCASNKTATKGLGAFDGYASMSNPENTLMGIAGTAGHFDSNLADVVNTYANSYYSAFTAALASTNVDAVGKDVHTRLMMYTPLYYLIDNSTYYNGGGTGSSTIAPFWRIRTGIKQGDTSLSTETNLALALKANSSVKDVDFETIWGMAHVTAEDEGTSASTSNFIAWVEKCVSTLTTGIEDVSTYTGSGYGPYVIATFNMNGVQVESPSHGINIQKMSDGTTRKVLVK